MNIAWFDDIDIKEFPNTSLAETNPDGLLAAGGNLSVETLQLAYSRGIFPWFDEDQPILWWSPSQRTIIKTDEIHISKNMKKLIQQNKFTVKKDTNFHEVISQCKALTANRQETWITDDMEIAYIKLFEKGIAHSIEVYKNNELVGGLYGIFVLNCFCGESMFSKITNTSKLALIELANFLRTNDCNMIDCQLPTAHLLSMGAKTISRENFIKKLERMSDISSLKEANWGKICHR